MFTIAAQNIHQATPAVLAVMKEEALNADERGFVLPVPLTVILFRPWQRVNLWPQLELPTLSLFLDGLATIAPFELDEIDGIRTPTGGFLHGRLAEIVAKLRAHPHATVAIHSIGSPIAYAHVLRNADGALDLFAATTDADLVRGVLGIHPLRLSLVQELLAAELGCPMGVLYQTATQARVPAEDADALFALPAADVKPDPWTTEEVDAEGVGPVELLEEHYRVPIRSLPLGRWTRELSRLLKAGPDEEAQGVDPWLESVARPLWRARRIYQGAAHNAAAEAQTVLLGMPCHDWAQAAWEWLEAQKGPKA